MESVYLGDASQFTVLYCAASSKKRKVWLEGTLSVSASKTMLFNEQRQTVTVVSAQAPLPPPPPLTTTTTTKENVTQSTNHPNPRPNSFSASSNSPDWWKELTPAQCNTVFRAMTTHQPPCFPTEETIRVGQYEVQIVEVKHAHLVPFVVPSAAVPSNPTSSNQTQKQLRLMDLDVAEDGAESFLTRTTKLPQVGRPSAPSSTFSQTSEAPRAPHSHHLSRHHNALPQQQQQQLQNNVGPVRFAQQSLSSTATLAGLSGAATTVSRETALPQQQQRRKRSREELLEWLYNQQQKQKLFFVSSSEDAAAAPDFCYRIG